MVDGMWHGSANRRSYGGRQCLLNGLENKQTRELALLRNVLEPMLQRELEHRGLDKANRGFEAKLIAWVEADELDVHSFHLILPVSSRRRSVWGL